MALQKFYRCTANPSWTPVKNIKPARQKPCGPSIGESKPVSRVLSSMWYCGHTAFHRRSGNHLSRPYVAIRLERPTRTRGGPPRCVPTRSCSGWGLPSQRVSALLVRSYRTVAPLPVPVPLQGGHWPSAVCISVALSLGSLPLGITQHPALWSSDFPRMRPFGTARAIARFTFPEAEINYTTSA
jgi:hypothetical protein